ncbi:ATP-binding cassette domain-containing protein [Streptomyces sp. NPDC048362]|uniref:ABC transporter ATP-binding protein n=1 Tax=Streptomyces sp. NPDC048362 TaxID=3365539 RepID=UPI003720EA9A
MIQAFGLTSNPRKAHPPAVDDVSFEARAGHVTALLGGTGAGKTTALRLMLELQPGRGITYFRGRPLHRIAHPSREVGVLLGDVPGHPARSVRGHLRMLCAASGVPARRADEVLEVVGLASFREERLGTLSCGVDRRLGLACALLPDPHTLVLDEPADGLSAREAQWLHGMLRAHARQGGTVLFTTADPKEAARSSDRVVTLDGGRLVADQDAREFARTRLRPRVAVRSPHAARLAALLAKEARTARRSVEVVREGGNRLCVYGTTTADIGETAFRNGILIHQLADEQGDMGPGAGAEPAGGMETEGARSARRDSPASDSSASDSPVTDSAAPNSAASARERTGLDAPVERGAAPHASSTEGQGQETGAHRPSEEWEGVATGLSTTDRQTAGSGLPPVESVGRNGQPSTEPDRTGSGPATAEPGTSAIGLSLSERHARTSDGAPREYSVAATGAPSHGHDYGAEERPAEECAISAFFTDREAWTSSADEEGSLAGSSAWADTHTRAGEWSTTGEGPGRASAAKRPETSRAASADEASPATGVAATCGETVHEAAGPTGGADPAEVAKAVDDNRSADAPAPAQAGEPGSPESSHPRTGGGDGASGSALATRTRTRLPGARNPLMRRVQPSLAVRPDGVPAPDAHSPLPLPISVRPARTPLRPLRYEIRRAAGVGTGFLTCGATLVVSALTAVVLARIGHTPQARLFAAWPRELPLPPAAFAAGLLGALAFGDEFRHPALAVDRGTVPRRLGLLTAKLLVAGATALLLAFLTMGCDAEVLYLVYGRELTQVPADWLSLTASWFGLVVGCAWAGVLAAGVFRSTTAGLAAVLAVPVLVVPLVHKALQGSGMRMAAGLPVRMRERMLLQWPFGGDRYLVAAVRILAQPVGGAMTLSLTGLLCAYVFTTLRTRVR